MAFACSAACGVRGLRIGVRGVEEPPAGDGFLMVSLASVFPSRDVTAHVPAALVSNLATDKVA